MNRVREALMLMPCLWLAACAGGDGGSAGVSGTTADAASPTAAQGFRMKSGEWGDDDRGKIAEKFGTNYRYGQNSQSQQSGEFNRDNPEFKGRWQGKEFDTKAFQKKSFWGDREYAKKVYGGDTDGSRFAKDSRFGGQSAREAGTAARDAGKGYATNDYKTGAAREAGAGKIERVTDAETAGRRQHATELDVIDWRDQRALTIEQTRRMLGRE